MLNPTFFKKKKLHHSLIGIFQKMDGKIELVLPNRTVFED